MPDKKLEVWTIGHSTRPIGEFVAALNSFRIEMLVDVREFRGSRRYPQFGQAKLSASLADLSIGYTHLPALGGRRTARPDSLNVAWRNEGFRGYADYMETEEFRQAVDRLLELGGSHRTAIMCAEAVWWRCHRGLISDQLKANGVEVVHIIDEKNSQLHPFTSAARVVNGELSYRGLLE